MDPSRPLVTISDLQDLTSDPYYTGSLLPTSPRSIEACLRLGIDPATLSFVPYDNYIRRHRNHDLAKVEFEHHEGFRRSKFEELNRERDTIERGRGREGSPKRREKRSHTEGGYSPGSRVVDIHIGDSDLSEKEAHRIEVLRRRKAMEVEQVIAFETSRREMEQTELAKVRLSFS